MFEIIIGIIIWTWGLTPLWANCVITWLLVTRLGLYWSIRYLREYREEDNLHDEK